MKRFEVNINLKIGISATSSMTAGLEVLKFIRYMIATAEWGKGIVVTGPDSVSSDDVKELPF